MNKHFENVQLGCRGGCISSMFLQTAKGYVEVEGRAAKAVRKRKQVFIA